jgi:hypothetical protein
MAPNTDSYEAGTFAASLLSRQAVSVSSRPQDPVRGCCHPLQCLDRPRLSGGPRRARDCGRAAPLLSVQSEFVLYMCGMRPALQPLAPSAPSVLTWRPCHRIASFVSPAPCRRPRPRLHLYPEQAYAFAAWRCWRVLRSRVSCEFDPPSDESSLLQASEAISLTCCWRKSATPMLRCLSLDD